MSEDDMDGDEGVATGSLADAVEAGASALHWKTEHLDPSDKEDWNLLEERERDFFRLCVSAVFTELEAEFPALPQALRR